MENQSTKSSKDWEISYRELEERARILFAEVQRLSHIQHIERLNFLFKVVEYSARFNKEFVESCVREIQEMLTIEDGERTDA